MTGLDQHDFDDVLDTLLAEFEEPTIEAIAIFSRRYPEFRAQLLDFAATWAEQAHLPVAPPLDAVREARIERRAQQFLDHALVKRVRAVAPPGGQSLSVLATHCGMTLTEVARQAGLDMSLITKLDGRRIRLESIPARLISRLADILRIDLAGIAQSLTALPQVAPAAMAFMPITIGSQQSFSDAVAASDLSPAEKDALLSKD